MPIFIFCSHQILSANSLHLVSSWMRKISEEWNHYPANLVSKKCRYCQSPRVIHRVLWWSYLLLNPWPIYATLAWRQAMKTSVEVGIIGQSNWMHKTMRVNSDFRCTNESTCVIGKCPVFSLKLNYTLHKLVGSAQEFKCPWFSYYL